MKKAAVAIALLLASLALVACGGSDDDDGSEAAPQGTAQESEAGGGESEAGEEEAGEDEAGGDALTFEAEANAPAFTSDTATWGPGEVTIAFTNPASTPHNVAIEDESGETIAKTEVISEGSNTTTADLKPGTYTFYCGVTGHREAGMEGTLTVE